MGKLRWTLLILGGLFIIALALWERWRPRQGRSPERHALEPGVVQAPDSQASVEPVSLRDADQRSSGGPRAGYREPWIGEPTSEEASSLESPPTILIDDAAPVDIDGVADESPTDELPVLSEPASDVAAKADLPEELPGLIEGVGQVRVLEPDPLESRAPVEPIVEWPPEDSRHIVALRLVAAAERFPGRAVRQALAAEGFLLGKFDIFHKPDETRRALVSAASLTRPGTFDLQTMDSQRYAGLNLFVVLPGPCPGQQAFDELIDVSHNLCERLQGELQDARGEALSGKGIETLRAALPADADCGEVS